MQLDEFAEKWDAVYPVVSQTWRRHWDRITPFFLSGRDSESNLHDQHGGIAEHVAALNLTQNAGFHLLKTGGGSEAVIPSVEKCSKRWTRPVPGSCTR